MPTALARSSHSWITLRRGLFALGALLVGIDVVSAVWDIRTERAAVERNALRDFSNLTALLAEQTARSLESVDQLLHAAVSDMGATGIGDPAVREARLKDRISSVPQVRGLLLLGSDGRVLVDTEGQIPAGLDMSDRAHFTTHLDGGAGGRYVSEPFQDRASGHWEFAVSERIAGRDGRFAGGFAGVLVAKMDVAYFNRLYRSLDIGGGFVGLMTTSGTLITRVPGPGELLGQTLPDTGGVQAALRRDGHFAGWALSSVQPGLVLISAAAIPGLPLNVVVGATEHTVLAPWRTEAFRIGLNALLTSAVVLALIALAARQLARRAAADERVRQSEERYALAVAGANDGIWDRDLVTDRMYYSRRALELLGVDPPIEGFRTFEEWETLIDFHPEDLPRRRAAIEANIAGETRFFGAEWRVRHADGAYRWVASHGLAIRDAQGRATRFAGSITDIEERKRYEETLRERQEMLRERANLLDLTHDAVFVRDMSDVITFWNRGAEEQYGWTSEEAVGQSSHVINRTVFPAPLEEINAELHRRGRWEGELVHTRRDGTRVVVASRWALQRDERGNPISILETNNDISERKLAEAEQVRLQTRLRQAEKMEAVGRLAGGIAHDFNNILGGILGYAEMVDAEAAEGTPMRRYARNLLTGANRARDLVDQILTYSRSQYAKRVPVEIDRIVSETLELVRGSLAAGIALDLELPAAPLIVIGDPTQLHQVVMNLCTNAIHAMSGSGTLRVALEPADVAAERALAHGTLAPGRYVRLTVADTGSGMDAATVARIFEPFFTTKEVGRGTGLGLSLVYGIVTDSAGAVHVTSELGRGSTFEIYLPRAEARASVAEADGEPVPRGNGERVLLVDDEEPLIVMTAEVLAQLGYEATTFTDGRAALEAFEKAPEAFQVVVTDEVMPALTGTELARRVRRLRPDLPIVLVSGYSGPILTQQALGAGVSELLKKPVQSRELAAALARVLHRAA